MKTRIPVAIAALFVASLGTAAYAQAQQTPQQAMPPSAATSPYTAGSNSQSSPPMTSGSMSNGSISHNGMSNGSMSSSSSRVAKKVKRELKSHGVSSNDVTVTFQNGTATLTGTVASQSDISKAKSAAMRVRGVKHVDTSGLQVQSTGGQ